MIIKYHKIFNRQFQKLLEKDKNKVKLAMEVFIKDPNSITLHNHALVGNLKGRRSFSVAPDLRIVFEEYDDYTLVIFFKLGNHNQVYK